VETFRPTCMLIAAAKKGFSLKGIAHPRLTFALLVIQGRQCQRNSVEMEMCQHQERIVDLATLVLNY